MNFRRADAMKLRKRIATITCAFKGHVPEKWERGFSRVNGKRKKAAPKRVFFTRCGRCGVRL